MKAAVVTEPDELVIRDLDVPTPGHGEVLIRLVATGICHTDLSVLRGNLPAPLPLVLGHEGAGVVEALGPGVVTLAVGDHVVCSIADLDAPFGGVKESGIGRELGPDAVREYTQVHSVTNKRM